VALAAECPDRLLDQRVPADLAALPGHRSPPRRELAAAPDRARTLPRPEPPRPDGTGEARRLVLRRPARRLPPRGAVLVAQVGHAPLHPQRELLMGLAVTRVDRPPVPNADRRPPSARPRAAL